MNTNAYEKLEFLEIRRTISDLAKSEEAKDLLLRLEPQINPNAVRASLDESDDGRWLAENGFRVPVHSLHGVKTALDQIGKQTVLSAQNLHDLGAFLNHCSRMKTFMKSSGLMLKKIADYASGLEALEDLEGQIRQCVLHGRVIDQASAQLTKIRRSAARLEDKIKERMDRYMTSGELGGRLQDDRYRVIDGKFVLPVKRASKNAVTGQVVAHSNTGTTAYVQPETVIRLQAELDQLRADEKAEEFRILSNLTNQAAGYEPDIRQNVEIMIRYDMILAKGRYSKLIDGRRIDHNSEGIMDLKSVRHPLLGDTAVPLDIRVGGKFQSLVITGPNTGGKTIALKTAALAALMTQSGIHVSCSSGSTLPIYEDVLVDIGDNQNIEQSLSTFSAHVQNIIQIVKYARPGTLVILDEIGTGTDPVEGTGLGIAILERLHELGAMILATTHFSEIKTYASEHEGFQTGSMAFDVESLRPLYRLDIGKPGESNAFLIALRLGLDYRLIDRAHAASYGTKKTYREISDRFKASQARDMMEMSPAVNTESEARKREAKQVRKSLMVSQKILESPEYEIGDAVKISGFPATGVVVELPDRKGEYTVLYKDKKIKVGHKRLKKYIERSQLYPEGYDMDIVTKSKSRRKKEKQLGKGHRDVVLEYDKEQ